MTTKSFTELRETQLARARASLDVLADHAAGRERWNAAVQELQRSTDFLLLDEDDVRRLRAYKAAADLGYGGLTDDEAEIIGEASWSTEEELRGIVRATVHWEDDGTSGPHVGQW